MAEQIIDIRERIEKMRIKIDVDQNEPLIRKNLLNNSDDTLLNESTIPRASLNHEIQDNNPKNINATENELKDLSKSSNKIINDDKPFPSVSLSVKNPISSKSLVFLMILQIFSNIGILGLLYMILE